MQELCNLLKFFNEATHFPTLLLHGGTQLYSFGELKQHEIPNMFYWDKINLSPGQSGYLVSDDFLFFGKTIPSDGNIQILLGPCIDAPCDMEKAFYIAQHLNLPSKSVKDLCDTLNSFPYCEFQDFVRYMNFLQYIINKSALLVNVVQTSAKEQGPIMTAESPDFSSATERNLKFEQELLQTIEFGRIDHIGHLLRRDLFALTSAGHAAGNPVRVYRNILISYAALFSRAAVKGGLNPLFAIHLQDFYIQRIEHISTYNAAGELWKEMLAEFTRRTSELQIKEGASSLVKSVSSYISEHLYEKVSVEEMAAHLNLNRSYLSRKFAEETGQTLSDYINEVKINVAKRMLRENKYTIADISSLLAFSSQSHFQTVFRRITDMTPAMYRQQH